MGGQKGDRHASRILCIDCIGQGRNERHGHTHLGGKAFRCKSEDAISHLEFADGRSDFGNDTGTFCSQWEVPTWIQTQCQQNVPEIEACRQYLNPNLVRQKWLLAGGYHSNSV